MEVTFDQVVLARWALKRWYGIEDWKVSVRAVTWHLTALPLEEVAVCHAWRTSKYCLADLSLTAPADISYLFTDRVTFLHFLNFANFT